MENFLRKILPETDPENSMDKVVTIIFEIVMLNLSN